LAADYKLTDGTLGYITARRAFNSGGINPAPPVPYKEEIINDVEMGIKNDSKIAGLPVRTNISVFHSKYNDIQRNVTFFYQGQPSTIIRNAASATIWGVEIENEARIANLELSAGYSYVHAKYDSFNTELSPGVTTNLTNSALAEAPKSTANATVAYHVPVAPQFASDVRASVTASYQSTIYFSDINETNINLSNTIDPLTQQGQYTIFNAGITATDFLKPGFCVTLYVKNLTNKLYAQNKESVMSLFGYATAIYGDPITWGASVRYRF
jgi:iron complex outermembrane receptor protein